MGLPSLALLITILFFVGSLAQSVEHLTFNQVVAGSNPARPTTKTLESQDTVLGFLLCGCIFLSLAFLVTIFVESCTDCVARLFEGNNPAVVCEVSAVFCVTAFALDLNRM